MSQGSTRNGYADKWTTDGLIGMQAAFSIWRVVGWKFMDQAAFLSGQHDSTVLLTGTGLLALYLMWRTRGSANDNLVVTAIAVGLTFGMTGFLARDSWRNVNQARVLSRKFYGDLETYDKDADGPMGPSRVLQHRTIGHGEQFVWPQTQRFATT